MSQSEDNLKRLIFLKRRRLQVLKEQYAMMGLNTPPHIVMEIEDLEEELAVLQSRVGDLLDVEQLGSSLHNSVQADLGEAPDVDAFFGREAELAHLEQWLVMKRYRVVMILGIGGMGKTALAVTLANRIKENLDYLFLRTLQNAPPVEDILEDCINFLSDQQQVDYPESLDAKISLLMKHLQNKSCLLVLDNLETILQTGEHADLYLESHQGYGRLIERIAQTNHQSCLLLTSREKPEHFKQLESKVSSVQSLQLDGLNHADGRTLLKYCGVMSEEATETELIHRFGGNPLAIKLASRTIDEWHSGDVTEFLKESSAVLDDIRPLLEEHLARLPKLGLIMLYWLAIERDRVSRSELARDILYWLVVDLEESTSTDLWFNMLDNVSEQDFRETLQILYRHALIEKSGPRFTLQPVIMEYLTEKIIHQVCKEILTGQIRLLQSHALMKALTKEYIRQSQVRLILTPIVEQLLSMPGVDGSTIEFLLSRILATVRLKVDSRKIKRETIQRVPGYIGGNTINLLLLLRSDLRGWNFSRLAVWQAYLKGARLPEVDFTDSDLSRSVFTETFGRVFCIAYSPDGELLAAGTENGDIHVWQTVDGQPRRTYTGHKTRVRSITFSPDGTLLASGSLDQTVRVWNLHSGQCLQIFQQDSHMVWSVAFSPNGRFLASAHQDKMIRIWDLETSDCVQILSGHDREVRTVIFGADEHTLISSSSDKTVRVWNRATGTSLQILEGHVDGVWSAACSDGKTIVSGGIGSDQTVRVWDIDTGACQQVLRGHADWVLSVALSRDGQTIASGSADRTVRLWDIKTGRCIQILNGHKGPVWSVVFSPDGATLSSGSEDQSVRVWEVMTGHCLRIFEGYSNVAWSVAFSPDGRTLASGYTDGAVRLWQAATGAHLHTFYGGSKGVRSVTFSPDGRTVASGSEDHTVRLWNVNTNQLHQSLLGHTDWVMAVAFTPDGGTIVSGSSDQSIRLWTLGHKGTNTPAATVLSLNTNLVRSIALRPDGDQFAVGSGDGTVQLWQLNRRRSRTLSDHTGWVMSVVYSADGGKVASGSNDRTVRILNLKTGQKRVLLHPSPVLAVTFSPDGTILASGSVDHVIRLWDMAHPQIKQAVQLLEGHTGAIRSLTFSPDGTILVSSSDDETIKLWDMYTGTCLKTLHSERPYEGMKITRVFGITETQKRVLKILGAIENET